MRLVDPGLSASLLAGRRGLATNSPPQLGHLPPSTASAQDAQNVHSNEQMRASPDSGGRSLLQHSQFGLSSSMSTPFREMHVVSDQRSAASDGWGQVHGTASGDLVLSTAGHWFSIDGNGVSFPVMRSIAIA